MWQQQTRDLGRRQGVRYVHAFENKGDVVGVSNPHPHGQLYATNFVFKTMEIELDASVRYLAGHGRGLVEDLLAAEQADGRRMLYEDAHTLAFVPYFARYAYEVYVVPKRRVPHVFGAVGCRGRVAGACAEGRDGALRQSLADARFPYVQVLHQAPTDAGDYRAYHFFVAFHPPLRRPNLLKYLAGPEVGGGNFLSDTSPEEKAAELRAQSDRALSRTALNAARRRVGSLEPGLTACISCGDAATRVVAPRLRRGRRTSSTRCRPPSSAMRPATRSSRSIACPRTRSLHHFDALSRDWPMLLVAEGLGETGRRDPARRRRARRSPSSSIRSTARAG